MLTEISVTMLENKEKEEQKPLVEYHEKDAQGVDYTMRGWLSLCGSSIGEVL